jgi:hypothetical protein
MALLSGHILPTCPMSTCWAITILGQQQRNSHLLIDVLIDELLNNNCALLIEEALSPEG